MAKLIKIAHSPDSDDAFMFYAIKEQKILSADFEFVIESDEISKLNNAALTKNCDYDIIALSFATLFELEDKYELMPSGCSFAGKDYGPKIISKNELSNLEKVKLAVPGKNTTAFLITKFFLKENFNQKQFDFIECSYDEVFDHLENNTVDASLLIHESQLRYKELGYKLLVDLGVWWQEQNPGLDLALGCNAIKKNLGPENIDKLNTLLKQSIIWGKENFEETLNYAKNFANNRLNATEAKLYIDMYVNDTTEELKDKDLISIKKLKELWFEINNKSSS